MRKKKNILLPFLFLVLLAALVLYQQWQPKEEDGQALECKIMGIADGDTLTAQCDSAKIRIRLMAIDAPEYDYKNSANIQPYARQSRDYLKSLCLHAQAKIFVHYADQYGRSVADVRCGNVDVSEAQIRAGMAWVYDRYASDYPHLHALQKSAQESRAGLWSASNPTPPWRWRNEHR
ncbi:MAG: thermonuclease family protein [Saezia sp.]